MTTQTITHLPISQLRLDEKANVRKTGLGVSPELLANIREKGIQLPLIVRPSGVGYVVTDGGMRLAAAQALVKNSAWTKDAPIPVIVKEATDAEARETSLALNVVRQAMHPVDEFRAFAALHTDKTQPLDVDSLAKRFGIASKIVAQRLALGSLDDTILDAWRDGTIRADEAQAFTLCPDKKHQVAIFAKLKKTGGVGVYGIKRELKVGQENVGRLLNAIGIETYEARGGKVTRDLFGSDHIVSDPALLKTLADEKVAAVVAKLAEEGWAWTITERPSDHYSYGHIEGVFKPTAEEKAKLKSLEKAIDKDDDESYEAQDSHEQLEQTIKLRGFTAAQKAKAGCVVILDLQDGTVEVEHGLVKPKEQKASAKGGKDAGGETKPKKAAAISQALDQRLRLQMLKATKTAIVQAAHQQSGLSSLGYLLANIVASQIDVNRPYGIPSDVERNLTAIRNIITKSVMNEHQRKTFDASDYFGGAPKAFNLKAITEAVGADAARKLTGKTKAEIAKFAIANVSKTGWLPKELRTANYDGPGSKAKAKKRK